MRKLGLILVLLSFVCPACGGGQKGDGTTPDKEASDKSLYDRLGGEAAIEAVVDQFLANVAEDARINSFFADTDIDNLKRLLVEQICEAAGGPCKYTGRSMKESHQGMGVKKEHFAALVEDLVKALDKFSVPEKEKNELLGLLGPMEADIVEQ